MLFSMGTSKKKRVSEDLGATAGYLTHWNDPEKCKKFGKNARKDYEMKYMLKYNYMQLIDTYEEMPLGIIHNVVFRVFHLDFVEASIIFSKRQVA